MTPRKSPRQNNKSSSSKPQNHETVIKQLEADNKALQSRVERLEGDNQDLQSRVGYLEYQAGILWSELEVWVNYAFKGLLFFLKCILLMFALNSILAH
ncbi:hypothetical protein DPMN_113221 [Dreissena polymorpha]|uniref:Uncharacterized protein n=1 Tax=Dreissena polymorpha TaxID=45954 RepID=A0A9D4KHX5_DREPO|nr:hypothetical protein DPMN_113221 [Dreissena polymorpha]